ncbi:hypothetical protein OOZ15_07635 [Galbibacter sp. EGI 63066]|uniref:hypothetical protein n=1 Tax=Galbibacter sp. EGI 63066 TaxID=2993559 RepID=UPI0022489B2A|nr:hypothetical protein [Galbibacter sp. EGI 63066]MCX2679804.1 hypothetical protein [Galbibacter sp. EGI 63066]
MKQQIQIFIAIMITITGVGTSVYAQKNLPYRELPNHPDTYTAGSMASRMVDGLGFRFYWATEGLRKEDLVYSQSKETRNVTETIDHILFMTTMLVNSIKQTEERPKEGLSFDEKRAIVLNNLKTASEILRKSDVEDLETYTIELRNGETFPFWNYINGPIADCIWHCGQIASFRRSSGNPFNSKVSLLRGTVRD